MVDKITPFSLTVEGNTYNGAMFEILVSGLNRIKEYVISAFRDIISNPEPEFSKIFLKDYFSLCSFVNKNLFHKDTKIFDTLLLSLNESDPITFISAQSDERLKTIARQIKGKQDIDDILDLLLSNDDKKE